MNIVQISSVVSGTATSGSLGFDATTSPVSFSAPTVAGNFILACCWVTGATTGSPLSTIAPASINPTGQALTFSYFALGENWDNPTSGSLANGSGGFFYLRNAPSILTSTTFTFTGQMSGGGGSGTYTMNVEFFLVEVSGISPTASYNAYARLYSNSGGTVNPGALSTSATTAVFVIFSGQGINIAAGTGYALLGSPASVAVTGQVQYRLGVASGSVPTAFTGTEPYWAALALAFAASAGVAPTITSPASATFTAGTNQAFTVTTTGTPTARVDERRHPAHGRDIYRQLGRHGDARRAGGSGRNRHLQPGVHRRKRH